MRIVPEGILRKACLEAGIVLKQDPGSISIEDANKYYLKIQQYETKITPKQIPNELKEFKALCIKKMELKKTAQIR
jgi:hypothetical protein